MKRLLIILILINLAGCAWFRPHVIYFNDDDKVYSGDENKQPPTPTFNWVLMSEGKYRTITTVNPTT